MKYLLLLPLLTSCTSFRSTLDKEPGFTVEAQIQRHSLDADKGMKILIFPLELGDDE